LPKGTSPGERLDVQRWDVREPRYGQVSTNEAR
jgi:hypothetical protein